MEENNILKVKIKSGHSKQPNNIAVGGGGRQAGHGGPFTGISHGQPRGLDLKILNVNH